MTDPQEIEIPEDEEESGSTVEGRDEGTVGKEEGKDTVEEAEEEGGKRKMRIAVAGCVHGEIDKVYATMAELEKDGKGTFDLLLCCGDFEATRNYGDLHHMHVSEKYRSLETFYLYYSGKKRAPVLTIFIGGNHEASGYMSELPYGGWVADNIFFMGFANVVRFAGLRIGGLSGIYKGQDYHKGHYECPPFREHGSIISAYHTRSIDVFRCKQLSPLDIFMSHDWPTGVWDYGDVNWLLQRKPHFTDDIQSGAMGNPGSREIMLRVRPHYWFSAHMHVGFAAVIPHTAKEGEEKRTTRFLSLDKPLPRRHFLQSLEIEVDPAAEKCLSYDEEWLAILKSTDHLMSATSERVYLPSAANKSERFDFRPTEEELLAVRGIFSDYRIPLNFRHTAPPIFEDSPQAKRAPPSHYYRNPQSTEFATLLGVKDLNGILADRSEGTAIPYYEMKRADDATADIQQDESEFGEADFIIDTRRDGDEGGEEEDEGEGDGGGIMGGMDDWQPPAFREGGNSKGAPVNAALDDWKPPAFEGVGKREGEEDKECVLKRRKVDYNEDE